MRSSECGGKSNDTAIIYMLRSRAVREYVMTMYHRTGHMTVVGISCMHM